jgi:hypothetical protein
MTSQNVVTRTITWLSMVLKADKKYQEEKRTEPAYEFSNGRKFLCTDSSDSGVYE